MLRAYHPAQRDWPHAGPGKRKGTANARLPVKVIWMRRTRVLRRMLAAYRESKKIDKHMCVTRRGGACGGRLCERLRVAMRFVLLRVHDSWADLPRRSRCYRRACRYHDLYLQVKGARYKTKRTLMETIHKKKAEETRVKAINDQAQVAKSKAETKKTKKGIAKKIRAQE